MIAAISPNEKWKLYSSFYRYNSTCISVLGGLTVVPTRQGGFVPLKGTMDYEPLPIKEDDINKSYCTLDATKEHYLRQFIETCQSKDIKLVFAHSPYYLGTSMAPSFPLVQKLCKEYKVAYIDCVDVFSIAGHKEFFKDSSHLNEDGADMYTRYFVSRIKQ
jgi:hypothetical protein